MLHAGVHLASSLEATSEPQHAVFVKERDELP
ncbi:hypothetical protein T07_2757 [Trichinella nelsoni]|uniref:Uncharacterized protein n=1 Tax=Trichinella nelsoni TaxID=6336 RepID=A0A0V0RBT8_9BILA|nr:hypothetical protein T07_2757 [Trichinella nelsoni]